MPQFNRALAPQNQPIHIFGVIMRKVYILKFVLALLVIVNFSNLAFSEEKSVNTIEQFVELDKKVQSLSDSIKNKENSNNIELAKNQLELANKIIDWSAMFFAALAALIVIAGAVGLKEFSKIMVLFG